MLLFVIRSLQRRWRSNLMTVAAMALSIAGCVVMFTYASGIEAAVDASAPPGGVIVMSAGQRYELLSSLPKEAVDRLSVMEGIRLENGQPWLSPELSAVVELEYPGGGLKSLPVRGVEPIASKIRPKFTLVEGRALGPRAREVMIGQKLVGLTPELKVGGKLLIGSDRFPIVGVFSDGGSAHEGEAWLDRGQLAAERQLSPVSSVRLIAASPDGMGALIERINGSAELSVEATGLSAYYRNSVGAMQQVLAYIASFSVLLAIAAVAAAATTLQASLLSRRKQFATLNLIGAPKGMLARLMVVESMALSVVATALALALAALADGQTVGDKLRFELLFDTRVLLQGVFLGAAIGVLGSLASQVSIRRMDPLEVV